MKVLYKKPKEDFKYYKWFDNNGSFDIWYQKALSSQPKRIESEVGFQKLSSVMNRQSESESPSIYALDYDGNIWSIQADSLYFQADRERKS